MSLIDPSAICISVVVLAELRFGFAKKKSFRLMSRLESLLDDFAVQAWAEPADRQYAEVRSALEREFTRVPGLRVENWLRAD